MGTKSWNDVVEFSKDYGEMSKQPNKSVKDIRGNRAKLKTFILESASSNNDTYNKFGNSGLMLENKNRNEVIRLTVYGVESDKSPRKL